MCGERGGATAHFESTEVEKAKTLKLSGLGELKMTYLSTLYLKDQQLRANLMGRGHAWLDAGSSEALLEANQFITSIQDRQGMKIACLEEVGFPSTDHLRDQAKSLMLLGAMALI